MRLFVAISGGRVLGDFGVFGAPDVLAESPAAGLDDSVRAAAHAIALRGVRPAAVGVKLAVAVEVDIAEPAPNTAESPAAGDRAIRRVGTERLDVMGRLLVRAAGNSGFGVAATVRAVDPADDSRGIAGRLTAIAIGGDGRAHAETGEEIEPGQLIATLVGSGPSRAEAALRLAEAVAATRVAGVETNLERLSQVLASGL